MDKDPNILNHLCIGEMASVFYRQFQIYINQHMKSYRVNSSEVIYLLKMKDDEAVTQTSLADMFFTDNAIVTRSLQSMEKKGLVVRKRSKEDKRSILVSLTAKGKKAREKSLSIRLAWKEKIFSGLSPEEEAHITSLYQKITLEALSITQGLHNKETDQ